MKPRERFIKKTGAIPDLPSTPPPPPLTGRTVEDDLTHNRNRVGPVDQGRKPLADADVAARELLKQAGYKFADAIRAYEEAAVALMGVDFNRGLTVAQWAKALRIKQGEMNLEGA